MVSGTLKSAKNQTTISCHFPHFHVVIYICMEKPALDNWKIVSRASLFKLVWKGVKSRLWSFVWSWHVMFWRFLKTKSFFNQNVAKFCLNRTLAWYNVPPLRWLFFRSTEWELGPFCSSLIPKFVVNWGDLRR